MNIAEAAENLESLVETVSRDGVSVDLERDNKVVARLTPASPRKTLTVGELNSFLQSLPRLGTDGPAFERDLGAIRAEFPAEPNPWE